MTVSARRLKLLGIVAAFAFPLLLATFAYVARDHLPLPGPKSYGSIISPARPLSHFSLPTADGATLNVDDLHGHWTLLYVGGACDLLCEANLFKMRQVRLALGKDTDRVQRLYLLTDAAALPSMQSLLSEHPGLRVALADAGQVRRILDLRPDEPLNTIYLLDPLANLMMRYEPHATAKGLLKDLGKLLRISSIG